MFPVAVVAATAAGGGAEQIQLPYLTNITYSANSVMVEDANRRGTTIQYPANSASGDFVIATMWYEGSQTPAIAPFINEGFTRLQAMAVSTSASNQEFFVLLVKVLDGTESASITLENSTTYCRGCYMELYKGNNPISDFAFVNNFGTLIASNEYSSNEVTIPTNSIQSHYINTDANWRGSANDQKVRLLLGLQLAQSVASTGVIIQNYSSAWDINEPSISAQQTVTDVESTGWLDWVAPSQTPAGVTPNFSRHTYLSQFGNNDTYRQVWASNALWSYPRNHTWDNSFVGAYRVSVADGGLGFWEIQIFHLTLDNDQYVQDYLNSLP